MKKWAILAALILFWVAPVLAQNQSASASLSITIVAAAPQHSATLTWTASPSTGVVGYNVYRSTGTASRVVIASVVVPALTYKDTTVAAGVTYNYWVTATDITTCSLGPGSSCESDVSNEWTGTIPTP